MLSLSSQFGTASTSGFGPPGYDRSCLRFGPSTARSAVRCALPRGQPTKTAYNHDRRRPKRLPEPARARSNPPQERPGTEPDPVIAGVPSRAPNSHLCPTPPCRPQCPNRCGQEGRRRDQIGTRRGAASCRRRHLRPAAPPRAADILRQSGHPLRPPVQMGPVRSAKTRVAHFGPKRDVDVALSRRRGRRGTADR
jgi:hypothetical protein